MISLILLSIYLKKNGINNVLLKLCDCWSKFVILLIKNANIVKEFDQKFENFDMTNNLFDIIN